uniref:Uncharacterized protein n=1 Tax=Romanomermis culicivorax TaxID=13658 RepID=A0A915KNA3_ROMCU
MEIDELDDQPRKRLHRDRAPQRDENDNWEKLSYHGSLGIIKADVTPLFVKFTPTGTNHPNAPSEEKISELLQNYFKSDYSKNELRHGMEADLEKLLTDKALPTPRRFKIKMRSHLKTVDDRVSRNGDFVKNNVINLRTNVMRRAHNWPKEVANTKLICADNSELDVYKRGGAGFIKEN